MAKARSSAIVAVRVIGLYRTMTRTQQIILLVLLIALAVAQYLVREGYFKESEAQRPDPLQTAR
jgi:hypothetical protein